MYFFTHIIIHRKVQIFWICILLDKHTFTYDKYDYTILNNKIQKMALKGSGQESAGATEYAMRALDYL